MKIVNMLMKNIVNIYANYYMLIFKIGAFLSLLNILEVIITPSLVPYLGPARYSSY